MKCTWGKAKAIVIVILYHISFSTLSNPTDSLYRVVYETHDIDEIEELVPIYQQQATDEALAELYFLVGWKYRRVEDLAKSFDYYKKSFELYYSNSDWVNAEKCLDNLAGIALRLNLYQKAYKYYHQAWELNTQLDDKKEIALSLRDLGITLSKTSEGRKKAIWYLTQASDLFEQAKEYKLLSESYVQMGVIHKNMEAYGSAMDCYSLALKHSPNSNDILSQVLNNQSNVLQLQEDYQRALSLQDSAIAIKRTFGNDRLLISSLNTLGTIQYKLGNFEKANESLIEAFIVNAGQKTFEQRGYENLEESYQYLDSVAVAIGDKSRLIEIGVYSVFVSKVRKFVAEQEAYRVRDMVYQGELLGAKEDLLEEVEQRNLIIFGLLFCLLVMFCIIIWNTIQAIKRKKRKQQELREMEDLMRKLNMPIP